MRSQGDTIRTVHPRGCKREPFPDVPGEHEVAPLLTTRFLGRHYRYFESIHSTSTFLASMPPDQAVHGTVVAADCQTDGRGRMQRTWHSPPGSNLYFSLLLRPDIAPVKAPQLALVTAAVLLQVLKNKFSGLHPRVKWPNDILVHGRKLAGILCEMQAEADSVRHVIIGIGINVNSNERSFPSALRDRVTSLRDATGKISSRKELLADILAELEKCYELWLQKGLLPLIALINENSALNDREITVMMQNREITGIARGLSDDGRLMLETPDGIHLLSSGEVHLMSIPDRVP